jgi:LysM repeat protein
MVKRRVALIVVVSILLLCTLGSNFALGVGAEEALYHTVRFGETLTGIARMYGVTVDALMEANSITNPNLIFAGQRLLIPIPADEIVVHVVAAGETLTGIAMRYGVTVQAIVMRNGITNPNLIFVGQRLIIPGGSQGEPTPEPEAPGVQEAIVITSPDPDAAISSPVTITGWGSGFENTLAVDIMDAEGNTIGQGFVLVDAELGQYGPFTGEVEFEMPAEAQLGRVQVYTISPRDGAIEHLASVTVNLQPS